MSLKKQFLKSKPTCKVTFRLSKEDANGADSAKLVGSFTNWEADAILMKSLKNGDFSVVVALPADEKFEYRYILDGTTWINDSEADAYKENGMGDNNSIVSTIG